MGQEKIPSPGRGGGSIRGWRGRGDGPKPKVTVLQSSSGCRVEAESAHRAISSAVEHLPYKEIVTGSIPVSPTSQIDCTARDFSNRWISFLRRRTSVQTACKQAGSHDSDKLQTPDTVHPTNNSSTEKCSRRHKFSGTNNWSLIQ